MAGDRLRPAQLRASGDRVAGPQRGRPQAIACHGLPWPAMACHGLPWPAMACHGLRPQAIAWQASGDRVAGLRPQAIAWQA